MTVSFYWTNSFVLRNIKPVSLCLEQQQIHKTVSFYVTVSFYGTLDWIRNPKSVLLCPEQQPTYFIHLSKGAHKNQLQSTIYTIRYQHKFFILSTKSNGSLESLHYRFQGSVTKSIFMQTKFCTVLEALE